MHIYVISQHTHTKQYIEQLNIQLYNYFGSTHLNDNCAGVSTWGHMFHICSMLGHIGCILIYQEQHALPTWCTHCLCHSYGVLCGGGDPKHVLVCAIRKNSLGWAGCSGKQRILMRARLRSKDGVEASAVWGAASRSVRQGQTPWNGPDAWSWLWSQWGFHETIWYWLWAHVCPYNTALHILLPIFL